MIDCSTEERTRWRKLGERLHEKMDEAIREAGLVLPEHPEDDEHNIAVGRAIEMIAGGDVQGGIAFYNGWSETAGYPGITLVAYRPHGVQIDIGTALPGGMIAELKDGKIEILTVGEWIRPGYMRAPASFRTPTGMVGRVILPVKALA